MIKYIFVPYDYYRGKMVNGQWEMIPVKTVYRKVECPMHCPECKLREWCKSAKTALKSTST